MSLIIATGTNLGDKKSNLKLATEELQKFLTLKEMSRVYESEAVEYEDQPSFYNQVLQFDIPLFSPGETMQKLLGLEKELGRKRDIPKGPRVIDLDILFWGLEKINQPHLEVPHPRLFDRSFVVRPLSELSFFKTLEKNFTFKNDFQVEAHPVL